MQRIIKSGNSLAVTIPTRFAKVLGLKKGDLVKIEKRIDKGTLTLKFEGVTQLSLNKS